MQKNRVKCGQLPNGVRFYSQYDSSSSKEIPIIAIMAGSFQDPPHRKGIAHLTEHAICLESSICDVRAADMLLARTCGKPDFGEWFITTDHTATTYGTLNSLKKRHARELFHMFADMIRNPVIKGKNVATEKAAVHQEHYWDAHDISREYIEGVLLEVLFPENFLVRIPIDGFMSHVRRTTVRDIKQFLHTHYIPENTIVVYLGPKHEQVKSLVSKEFGDWGNKSGTGFRQMFTLPPEAGGFMPLQEHINKKLTIPGIHQTHALVGFPTETYLSEDAEALDVLASILSRVMLEDLRTENIGWKSGTYRTWVLTQRTYGHGLLSIHFASLDPQFVDEGIKKFRSRCKEMGTKMLPREEVEVAVGYMYDYEFRDWFSTNQSELAEEIIVAVSNGDVNLKKLHSRGERLLKFLKRDGRERLRTVAQKYFSHGSAAVIGTPDITNVK